MVLEHDGLQIRLINRPRNDNACQKIGMQIAIFFTIIISFVNEFMDFVLACVGKKFAWKHKIKFEKAAQEVFRFQTDSALNTLS